MQYQFTEGLLKNWKAEVLFIYVFSWIIAAGLSFAVGANDCANSFGTAVGSKTISLNSALILASIFESLGAIFLSGEVGTTIRKGLFEEIEFQSFPIDLGDFSEYSNVYDHCQEGISKRVLDKKNATEIFLKQHYCYYQYNATKVAQCTWPLRLSENLPKNFGKDKIQGYDCGKTNYYQNVSLDYQISNKMKENDMHLKGVDLKI